MTIMRKPIRRGRAAGLALVAASLALAAPAGAQTEPPSAVDQYVEMVPTAGGPSPPGKDKKKPKQATSQPGKDALKGASPKTAATLEEVATSSLYGAPEASTEPAKPKPLTPVRDTDSAPDKVNTTLESAGAVAATSTSDTRLLGLLGAVFVTTLVAVALAIRRAR